MLGRGEPEAWARVDAAATALTAADAKGMLAFLLTIVAERDLATGGAHARARELAQRALGAADAIGKPSACVLAHVALAKIADACDDRDEARHHLEAAARLVVNPYAVSKRAREALREAARHSNAGTNAEPTAAKLRTQKR
jgi:hypothetical protein